MKSLTITLVTILSVGVMACGQKKETKMDSMKPSMEMSGNQMQHDMKSMDMKDMEGMKGMKGMEGMKGMKGHDQAMYYTCPMKSHKHIHSDEPGKCPECGMNLVKVVETTPDNADFWGCPMPQHSEVRSDKPGKCPECGMD